MTAQGAEPYSREDETPAERIDRNWDEMLQELRVVQTGVQILSVFLLTLPFQQRFVTLTDAQRTIFLIATSLATVSMCLLVSPVSSHRLLFRKHEKDALVDASNVLVRAGLSALALTVVTAVLLIFSVVAGTTAAVIAAATALVLFMALWVALPLALLRSGRRQRPGV
jgi:hypothetical protein